MADQLSAAQEAEAQALAQRFADATRDDFLQMARLLVAAKSPFGQTEFQMRDIVHRAAARLVEESLAGKKTATTQRA